MKDWIAQGSNPPKTSREETSAQSGPPFPDIPDILDIPRFNTGGERRCAEASLPYWFYRGFCAFLLVSARFITRFEHKTGLKPLGNRLKTKGKQGITWK